MSASGEILTATEARPPADAEETRRARTDRRQEPSAGRRGQSTITKRRVFALLGDVAVIVVLIAAIVFAVNHAKPIFAGHPTVVQSLTERLPAAKTILAPKDT